MSDIFGIGGVIGGLLGYKGTKDTNKANREIADQATSFNAQEAAANRTFQAEQSATAYQRAVADMSAAGLNPMLVYQQGGASTPSGATAQAVTTKMDNPLKGLGEGISSAAQLAQTVSSIDNTEANTTKAAADTAVAQSMVPKMVAEARATNASAAQAEAELAQRFPWLVESAKFQSAEHYTRSKSEAARYAVEHGDTATYTPSRWQQEAEDRRLRNLERSQGVRQSADIFPFELREKVADAMHREYGLPEARNKAAYEDNFWGGKYERYLPDLGSVASSAVGAAAGARLAMPRGPSGPGLRYSGRNRPGSRLPRGVDFDEAHRRSRGD